MFRNRNWLVAPACLVLAVACGSSEEGPAVWWPTADSSAGTAGSETKDAAAGSAGTAGKGSGGHAGTKATGGHAGTQVTGGAGGSGGSLDAASEPVETKEAAPEAAGCGTYQGKEFFNCAPDGMGRGKCVNDSLVFENCPTGCLIMPSGQDDVCLGDDPNWSCDGTMGETKAGDGNYYLTSFGCWTDENGNTHQDSGDNCQPGCFNKAVSSGLCAGMSGPECEETVNWYTADNTRFGCLARLRVTNPENGKSVIVVVLDGGPACWVEEKVSRAILDASSRVGMYLFGTTLGWSDKALVHVVEVDQSTPLGPVQ